jgi:hypothetical protein
LENRGEEELEGVGEVGEKEGGIAKGVGSLHLIDKEFFSAYSIFSNQQPNEHLESLDRKDRSAAECSFLLQHLLQQSNESEIKIP